MHSKLKNGRWKRSGWGSLAILSGRIIKVKTREEKGGNGKEEEEVATVERKLPPRAGKTMEG